MLPAHNQSSGQKRAEDRSVLAGSIACGVLAFMIFLATMPPSLTWAHYGADGGDLAAAIVRGALPHPPGFPVYLLFGDLFLLFPFGEPAGRLNVMSAFFAASAVVLLIVTAWRAGAHPVAAMTAGLSLAYAPLFWSQAIIVEVYACAACFAALLLFLAASDAPVGVRGLGLGIAAGAHPVLILFAPAVMPKPDWFKSVRFGCAFLIGWLLMYVLVLFEHNRAPSPWGDVSTFAGWWAFVSGELYRGYLFALPLADLPARLLAFLALSVRQFTPLGALAALIGLASLWRARRRLALASAGSFTFVALFAIGYNTTDSFVYLTVALPLAALWLAFGLSRWIHFVSGSRFQVSRWIVLLLPLAQLISFYGEINLHTDRTAMEWAESVLRAAPPQAIVLTERDAHTFTLWYARAAMQWRPDVIVLDPDLWASASYRQMMAREFGWADDLTLDQIVQQKARPLIRVSDGEMH